MLLWFLVDSWWRDGANETCGVVVLSERRVGFTRVERRTEGTAEVAGDEIKRDPKIGSRWREFRVEREDGGPDDPIW